MGGQSETKVVIDLVRADPEPVVFAVSLACDGAVTPANFGGVNAALLLEAERRMPWIGFEEREVLLGESLHVLRQRIVAPPERSEHMGPHGKGRKFPASISASIFSKAEACLPPVEKSSSNCSSQESLSCFAM